MKSRIDKDRREAEVKEKANLIWELQEELRMAADWLDIREWELNALRQMSHRIESLQVDLE